MNRVKLELDDDGLTVKSGPYRGAVYGGIIEFLLEMQHEKILDREIERHGGREGFEAWLESLPQQGDEIDYRQEAVENLIEAVRTIGESWAT